MTDILQPIFSFFLIKKICISISWLFAWFIWQKVIICSVDGLARNRWQGIEINEPGILSTYQYYKIVIITWREMTPNHRGSWFVISSVIYARQALGDQIEFIYGDMGQCLSRSHAQQGPIITVISTQV